MLRSVVAIIFLLLSNIFVLALANPEPETEHNCLADVIHSAHALQRRASGDFGYDGEKGPLYWADLDPKNTLCRSGKYQSPINFDGLKFRVNATRAPFTINWEKSIDDLEFLNEGVTGKVIFPKKNKSFLIYKGVTYKLAQFHFHTPSEHHFDHDGTDAEVHFVHLSDDGKILVLGGMISVDFLIKPNYLLAQLIPYLPIGPKETVKTIPHLSLRPIAAHFLETPLHTYEGSLTTPPCTEGVRFFISSKPMSISLSQFKELRKVVKFSSRLTMSINGRSGSN